MMPIVAGAVAVWSLSEPAAGAILRLTMIWAGAVVCFLAGVRRGLSFRQDGGPTLSQLGTMLWLFTLGAASLLSIWPIASLTLLLIGYVSLAVLDPMAASRGEAPRYFERLRPVQMLLPLISLLALLARVLF